MKFDCMENFLTQLIDSHQIVRIDPACHLKKNTIVREQRHHYYNLILIKLNHMSTLYTQA